MELEILFNEILLQLKNETKKNINDLNFVNIRLKYLK